MSEPCRDCKGAGRTYRKLEDMHPMDNVAHALLVFENGAEVHPMSLYLAAAGPSLHQKPPYRGRRIGYSFACDRCNSSGTEPQSALFKLGMPMWRLRRLDSE